MPPSVRSMASLRQRLQELRSVQTEDLPAQARALEEWIGLISDQDLGAIVRCLSHDELVSAAGSATFELWLTADPFQATAWIAAQADPPAGSAGLAARRLAEDPDLEIICRELPATAWKDEFITTAALELSRERPIPALAMAQQMSPGEARAGVFQTIGYDLMTRDPAAASALLEKVGDSDLRESLLGACAKGIAFTDPDLALVWLATAGPSTPRFTETVLSVVELWAAKAPLQAANWAGRFPDPQLREAAVETLLRKWWTSDPVAAAAWVAQLPEGPAIFSRLKTGVASDANPDS